MRSIREQLSDLLGGDSLPDQGDMIIALNRSGKHIYAGTVPRAEINRRRAANRQARKSRRINRRRS